MLVFIVFVSCLLYPLSLGQANNQPTVGPIYAIPNNDSLLNFTFLYPSNYQFDELYVTFTIYDFNTNDPTNFTTFHFAWLNFTNSNFSLPWAVPPVILQSGDYIIGCFEWVQENATGQLILDTYECVLTRAPINGTILLTDNPTTTAPIVTNTTIIISAYFPEILPYDQVNITSILNGTILPSISNLTSNINTFIFTNLIVNTCYNVCIYFSYENSQITGSQKVDDQCQLITTSSHNSSKRFSSNLTIIIFLLFLFTFI